MTTHGNSLEQEHPYTRTIEELLKNQLDPLFAQEPGWKPSGWPLFHISKRRSLEYWESRDHESFYTLLLDTVRENNHSVPVIVNAVEMVRRGYSGLSKIEPDITDEDRRFFLDTAAELSIADISSRHNRNEARKSHYNKSENSLIKELSANPEHAIETLRGFQASLRERYSVAPPSMRK